MIIKIPNPVFHVSVMQIIVMVHYMRTTTLKTMSTLFYSPIHYLWKSRNMKIIKQKHIHLKQNIFIT
jgi:hypothetical protein